MSAEPYVPNDVPLDMHRDPAAWDRLIESVGPDSVLVVISGWMGKHLRTASSPEDIWQETLAAAWRDRAQHAWVNVRAYRAWLLGIARHRVQDLARRIGARKRGGDVKHALFSDMGFEDGAVLTDLLPAGSTTPSRVAHALERSRRMAQALGVLPPELQTVVRAHLFEERPMTEISETMGIGLSMAWRRFRKGATLYAEALRTLESGVSRG